MLYSLDSNGKIANGKKTDRRHPKVGLEPIWNIFTVTHSFVACFSQMEPKQANNQIDWFGLRPLIGAFDFANNQKKRWKP